MLNFDKLSKIYFSPSGTTAKIVNEIAKTFPMMRENYDLLSFDEEKTFSNELVIIGVPVFDGRIPKIARERLSKIKGDNTKAIAVLNYGNMDYGDALLELSELLKENKFDLVGVATTVSQHSQFSEVGKNRPDERDLKKIKKFSEKIKDKLESGKTNELFFSGTKPYHNYVKPEFSINCDEEICTYCNDCVYTCPEDAITENNPTMTDLDSCTRCSTCINVCSENARSFCGEIYDVQNREVVDNFSIRQESEFYL